MVAFAENYFLQEIEFRNALTSVQLNQLHHRLIRLCSHESPVSRNESRDSGDTKLVSTFPIGVHRIPETTLPGLPSQRLQAEVRQLQQHPAVPRVRRDCGPLRNKLQRVSGSAPLLPETIPPTSRVPVRAGCYRCGNGFRKLSFLGHQSRHALLHCLDVVTPLPEQFLQQNPESGVSGCSGKCVQCTVSPYFFFKRSTRPVTR